MNNHLIFLLVVATVVNKQDHWKNSWVTKDISILPGPIDSFIGNQIFSSFEDIKVT